MAFVPVQLEQYVRMHVKNNPGESPASVEKRLRSALAAYKAGRGCSQCGAPIWVIGPAQVGFMCFTCITGEAVPSEDYEIAEACDKS